MSCADFAERIALRAGGDLEGGEARILERHLRECPACAALACALESDSELVRMAPPEAATADYAAMRREIRRGIAREGRRSKVMPVLLAAAAVLLAIAALALRRAPERHEQARIPAPAVLPVPLTAPEPPAQRQASPKVGRRRVSPSPVPKPDPALEAALRDFLAAREAAANVPPAGEVIPTKNPDVILILLDETSGGPHE